MLINLNVEITILLVYCIRIFFRLHLFNRGVDLFRRQAIVKRRIEEKSVIVSMVIGAVALRLMYSISI